MESGTIQAAVAILRKGGVVAYPTDTLYGLAVDPRRHDAVEKLFEVKGRDPHAAIPLIAGSVEQAADVAVLGETELRLARRSGRDRCRLSRRPARGCRRSSWLAADGGGARAVPPGRLGARARVRLLHHVDEREPVGRAPARTIREAVRQSLGTRIDCLVDAGMAPGGPPSTIVDDRDGVPVLVRAGAIAWDRVLEFLQ